MADRNVTDTQGRVWRRCAIPDGVTLANGQSKEKIEAEIKKSKERRKEQERNARAKAVRKAKAKREKARKEWEERPHILYTPMGNRR
jgi:single-stranded DNA-specific DHH superfamily exonuclease